MTSISDTNVVNAPGGLVELAYSQITAPVNITSTTFASPNNVISDITVVCDGSPIIVEIYSPYLQTSPQTQYSIIPILRYDGNLYKLGIFTADANLYAYSMQFMQVRLTPSAGVHTFGVAASTESAQTAVWGAGSGASGGAHTPSYIRISKVIQASQLIVQTPNAPLVTSLPSNAIDGQEVRYLADNTNGIIWNFRYRAGSSSTYKWEFIGGVPLFSSYRMTETADSTTSNTYVDLGGPSIVAPLAGDYDVIITGNYYSGAASGAAFMSVNFGGATTLDDDGILFAQAAQYSHQESRKKIRKLNTITSGMTVGTRYRTYSGSTQSNFRRRTIELIPIRVSA